MGRERAAGRVALRANTLDADLQDAEGVGHRYLATAGVGPFRGPVSQCYGVRQKSWETDQNLPLSGADSSNRPLMCVDQFFHLTKSQPGMAAATFLSMKRTFTSVLLAHGGRHSNLDSITCIRYWWQPISKPASPSSTKPSPCHERGTRLVAQAGTYRREEARFS